MFTAFAAKACRSIFGFDAGVSKGTRGQRIEQVSMSDWLFYSWNIYCRIFDNGRRGLGSA